MRVTFFFAKKKVTKEKAKQGHILFSVSKNNIRKEKKVNDGTYSTWLYSVIFHISSFHKIQNNHFLQ